MHSTGTTFLKSLTTAAFVLGVAGPQSADAGGKAKSAVASIFDASKRKRTKHEVTPHLSYGAYANARYLGERDVRRDDGSRDKMNEFSLTVGLVGRAHLGETVMAFVHGEVSLKDKQTDARSYGRIMDPRLKEALVAVSLSPQMTVSLGRMRFSDPHKWVADASVDGIHFAHKTQTSILEFAAFKGTEDNTATYMMAHLGYADAVGRWGGIALAERADGANRLHLSGYYGARYSDTFSYQANVGTVLGDAAHGERFGIGFDIRGIKTLGAHKLKPQLMFGLAYGSDGFLQSGLHSNKTYDGGQTQFNRYGFAYQAELTNVAVASVGVGIRPSRKLSADLIANVFLQPSFSLTAPDARFEGKITGTSKYLGAEISAVGAYRPSKTTKFELGVGRFMPGPAYEDQSSATRVFTRFSIYF